MLNKIAHRFEEWLLPRSRTLLLGLLCANICLAFALIAFQDPQVGVASPAPVIDKEIQLLAEVSPLEPAPKPTTRECRLWGPESKPEAFDPLVAVLDESGGFPEVQSQEVKSASDYLVYVGELGARANARRIARELSALQIESYQINRDDGTIILSVGLFSRQQLAEKHQKRVAELGYSVFVEELERRQTIYNLVAHVEPDSELYKTSTSACMAIAHNG